MVRALRIPDSAIAFDIAVLGSPKDPDLFEQVCVALRFFDEQPSKRAYDCRKWQ